jgi:Ca-activated chloride channel family protein
MYKRVLFVPRLVALLLAAVSVAAQKPAAPTPSPSQESQKPPQITIRVERVPVLFSALDRKERFVTDLSKDEINVLDNKKKQEVLQFTRETDLPLRIALLIDASNSIRARIKFEQEAAIEFLNSVLRPKTDRAMLLAFDTNAEVVQDFTDDIEKLSKAIHAVRPGGGTAMYDAIYYAVRDKLMAEEPGGSVRRTLIIISDGDDNQSRASREDTLAMAQRGEITIFAISTNRGDPDQSEKGSHPSGGEQQGDKVLRRFAEETGGRVFFPFKVADLNSSFERIGQELRSQYALLYRPNTPRDGSFHTIEVQSLRKGVKIRARKGYFAVRE